jgi:hypothetical protein
MASQKKLHGDPIGRVFEASNIQDEHHILSGKVATDWGEMPSSSLLHCKRLIRGSTVVQVMRSELCFTRANELNYNIFYAEAHRDGLAEEAGEHEGDGSQGGQRGAELGGPVAVERGANGGGEHQSCHASERYRR